eukprot:6172830-Pleurochrysis_carterae.AAC.1
MHRRHGPGGRRGPASSPCAPVRGAVNRRSKGERSDGPMGMRACEWVRKRGKWEGEREKWVRERGKW